MAPSPPIDLPLDRHPDLLGDPTGGDVLGPDKGNEPLEAAVVEHPVAGGDRRLRRVAATPQVAPDVPAELDLVDALDVEDRRPAVADELAGRAQLDPEVSEPVPLERAMSRSIQPSDSSREKGCG